MQYHLVLVRGRRPTLESISDSSLYSSECHQWEIDMGSYSKVEARANYHFLKHSGGYKQKHLKLVTCDSDDQAFIDDVLSALNSKV